MRARLLLLSFAAKLTSASSPSTCFVAALFADFLASSPARLLLQASRCVCVLILPNKRALILPNMRALILPTCVHMQVVQRAEPGPRTGVPRPPCHLLQRAGSVLDGSQLRTRRPVCVSFPFLFPRAYSFRDEPVRAPLRV